MKRNYLKCSGFFVAIATTLQLVSGCHAGGGPVIGYAFDRGVMLGWEAGGGSGPAHFNVGGSYRSEEKRPEEQETSNADSDRTVANVKMAQEKEPGIEAVHYVVFEPWLFVGATVGAGISTEKGLGFVGGLWEGWALAGGTDLGGNTDCLEDTPEDRFFFSTAVGFRYNVGAWELYLTPKAGFFRCVDWMN